MTTYLLAVTVDDDGADSAAHLANHIEHVVGHNSSVYSDEDITVRPVSAAVYLHAFLEAYEAYEGDNLDGFIAGWSA